MLEKEMYEKRMYVMILAIFLTIGVGGFSSCMSDLNNVFTTEQKELPEPAQFFLQNHFADEPYKINRSGFSHYEVSVKYYDIDFDSKGEWKKIETDDENSLSADILALVPNAVLEYINQYYQGRGICKVSRENGGYEVELTGNPDIDLYFNSNGLITSEKKDNEEGDNKEEDNDKTTDTSALPELARTFIDTHYNNKVIKKIDLKESGYKVKFKDGTTVDFSSDGTWKRVKVEDNVAMPESVKLLLPEAANLYISANYGNMTITKIEAKDDLFIVQFISGANILFDANGKLWSDESSPDGNNDYGQSQYESLPDTLKNYLSSFFSGINIKYVNINKSYDEEKYKIGLTDGTTLIFSADYELQLISRYKGIPEGAVLPAIDNYVKSNYPNSRMTLYKKEYRMYIVEISGYPSSKLFFNLNGDFKYRS